MLFLKLAKADLQNWAKQFPKTGISALRPDRAIVVSQISSEWSNQIIRHAIFDKLVQNGLIRHAIF